MIRHTIKKGFDIKLAGAAAPVVTSAPEPLLVGLDVTEFAGVKPKLLVEEGASVATGTPLLLDKNDRDVQWLSPVTGTVAKIALGERRTPLRLELIPGARETQLSVPAIANLAAVSRAELIVAWKRAGLWPLLRQRPFGRIARSAEPPTAIYVNAMDTEPLACDPLIAAWGLGAELRLGIDALQKLTDGKVYLTVRAGANLPPELTGMPGVEVHAFAGPHPAGLVGTHIARIAPLARDQTVWYLKAQEAVRVGQWLRTGAYPAMRVVAVAGSRAPERRYFKVREGALLLTLCGAKPPAPDTRVIDGTVLSGRRAERNGTLGFYTHTVTMIPEGDEQRDFLGWARPMFGKLSASRSVLSWLFPKREYELDARLHGGPRAIVNIGAWDRVTPLDIHPAYLVRAIQANDVEEAVSLGLLEVTEEDVALCTFVDPCKIDVGKIVRRGLELYEAEG